MIVYGYCLGDETTMHWGIFALRRFLAQGFSNAAAANGHPSYEMNGVQRFTNHF